LCSIEIEYHATVRACSWLAVAILAPAIAVADEPARPATVVIDFAPASGAPAWLADAFEVAIVHDLAAFERLTPVAKQDLHAHTCGADAGCRVAAYRRDGIDIVLFGSVSDGAIAYELYQTWTPARLETGTVDISRGQSEVAITHATRDLFRAVLKHGGVLDQRAYSFKRAEAAATAWTGPALPIALVVILALALPYAAMRRWPGIRRALWPGGAIAAAALGASWLGALVEASPWLCAGAGGLAWGALVVIAVRAAFPPLEGLARIPAQDLPRILGTWLAACGERLVLLSALYGSAGWLAGVLGEELAIPAPWTVILLAPATIAVARAWLDSWVDCLAVLLDRRLVDGIAWTRNPWSRELSDYLMGYIRRTGWDLDPELLRNVILLPGKPGTGIATYGGGSTHARIVIDRELLELAMGPLVEVKPDEKPALWPDWTAAIVVPRPGGSAERRAVPSADDFRGRKLKPSYPGVQRKPLGQAATLLGYVMPVPGQIAPLISDNPRDLAVVRELLSEHFPWFAPDPDDEYDATDPSDRDFLFGALARELGVVRRGETMVATLHLAIPPKLARALRLDRLRARYGTRLADSYAAINFARHHLIQLLHYQRTGSTELLTARASRDRLHHTSTTIFEATRGGERRIRARVIWLSGLFDEPIFERRRLTFRRAVVAGTALAVLAGAGVAVSRAIDYHPIYLERIDAQVRALAEFKQKGSHGEGQDDQK
jgi:hypothetical protein